MIPQLLISIILINLALILYSIGVWSERIARLLKRWHLIFFWSGFVCDTIGTGIMFDIAGGISFDIHSMTGVAAIALMLIHAIWASVVLILNNERAIVKFHHFSIFVWIIWLIPFLSGFLLYML